MKSQICSVIFLISEIIFESVIRSFSFLLFFILILRDSDLFCFRHEVMLLLLITTGQNRSKYKFSLISKAYFSRANKVILPKTVPGVPKKYISLKSKTFVLRTDQSIKLVSFVKEVLNLDFDT